MSDLDKLEQVKDTTAKPMTDEDLKKRVGGRIIAMGEGIHLSELDYGLKKLHVGAGWDLPGVDPTGMDIDLSLFLLDRNDQTREDSDFVFYNNLKCCEGAVVHQGDNRASVGEGDDETILIELNGLPFDILKIVFVVSIYDAEMRDQNISQIRNCFIRIANVETGVELLRFTLPEVTEKNSYALVLAELDREGPVWRFVAKGEPVLGNLGKIATQYGIMVTG